MSEMPNDDQLKAIAIKVCENMGLNPFDETSSSSHRWCDAVRDIKRHIAISMAVESFKESK